MSSFEFPNIFSGSLSRNFPATIKNKKLFISDEALHGSQSPQARVLGKHPAITPQDKLTGLSSFHIIENMINYVYPI